MVVQVSGKRSSHYRIVLVLLVLVFGGKLRETGLMAVLGHFYYSTNYIKGSFLHDQVLGRS